MNIRLAHDDRRHRLDATRRDDDPRLAYTVCGIRFAWGTVRRGIEVPGPCEGCHGWS